MDSEKQILNNASGGADLIDLDATLPPSYALSSESEFQNPKLFIALPVK